MSKTKIFWSYSMLFLLIAASLIFGCFHTFSVRSVYLKNPIGGARQITIEGQLDEAGTILVNPNTCHQINQFGDPGICTLMAFRKIEVTFQQVDVEDKTGKGRKVYKINGNFGPPGNLWLPDYNYYLVAPASRNSSYRFVVEENPQERRGITLEQK